MASAVRRYRASTVGASSVTLTADGPEHLAGPPMIFGTGTIVVTTTSTPDADFWKNQAGVRYLVTIEKVSS